LFRHGLDDTTRATDRKDRKIRVNVGADTQLRNYSSSKPGTGGLTVARFPSGTGAVVVPCNALWSGVWTTNGIICWDPSAEVLVPLTTTDTAVHFGKPTDLGISPKDIRDIASIDAKRFVYLMHEDTREEQAIGIITPGR
jgi:hypothetical protein